MPIVECGYRHDDHERPDDVLVVWGPTIMVSIGFDPDYQYENNEDGTHPKSQITQVPALIDTGAGVSCIDDALAKNIGLPIIDRQMVSGVGGATEVNTYLGHIYIPALDFTQWGQFMGALLTHGGQRHQALIGRTLLRNSLLVYDGREGQVKLAQ